MDIVGIYMENHEGRNRDCFIWIRFDHGNVGEKGSIPHLREDALISKTCVLEGSASHLLVSRSDVSEDFQYSAKSVADLHLQRSYSEAGVDTIGIYVENHFNQKREFLIRMRFDV